MNINSNTKGVKDIFQPGLIRGGENLAFDPEKKYFYVEHPTEGWRVYLRSCCFIHKKPSGKECIDPSDFIVVKRTGKPANGKEWEPPKGQMEFKDSRAKGNKPILELLKENVTREVEEESRLENLLGLRHTNLVFQGREDSYPPNHYFQYHIFQALVTQKEYEKAAGELEWYRAHPLAFARLRRDKKEKDAIEWFNPSKHKIMGKWSPKIIALYLSN